MIVFLNGQFIPASEAHVSVFDRGFLFGDGIYEGLRAHDRCVIALDRHLARLKSGLATSLFPDMHLPDFEEICAELIAANQLVDAFIYWQLTRGTPPPGAPVRHRVPPADMNPTVFAYAVPCKPVSQHDKPEPRRAALVPDLRWSLGHVKSISLIGNVISSIAASNRGFDDAIFVRDDLITEGASTNVFLSSKEQIVTPSLESAPMLAGVTRDLILQELPSIEQRPVSKAELLAAEEIMLVGTQTMVVSVVELDGKPVGSRRGPGPQSQKLLDVLKRAIDRDVHSRHV